MQRRPLRLLSNKLKAAAAQESDGWWFSGSDLQQHRLYPTDRFAEYERFTEHFDWRQLQYSAPVTAMSISPPLGSLMLSTGLINTVTAETSQASSERSNGRLGLCDCCRL